MIDAALVCTRFTVSLHRQRDDRGAVRRGRVDGPRDHVRGHERTRGVVNQHDLGRRRTASNAFATESCRRAPPATTRHPGLAGAIGRRRGRELRRQRDDDVVDPRVRREGVDAPLEDRPAADLEQLLRRPGAKPASGSARPR